MVDSETVTTDKPSPARSGELLKDARTRAGLTQAELADRAGLAQPVISAYESGRREPSLPMLVKLVDAAGYDLVIDLSRKPPAPGTRLQFLRARRDEVIACARRRGARNVRVFGSTARGDDRADSDIDLLVDLDEGVRAINILRLQDDLENLLGVDVDVGPAADLNERVRDEVLSEAIPL